MEKTPPDTPEPSNPDWDENISFGDLQVDQDHHHISLLIYRLQWLESHKPDREATHAVFNDLVEFAIKHFKWEENFLRSSGYPQTFEHSLAHERLLSTLIELLNDLTARSPKQLPSICRQIRELVCRHHATEDGHSANWLARHPGPTP